MIALIVSCSRCGAARGKPCRQPKGKKRPPHAEREAAGMRARLWKIGHVAEKMREKREE